MRRLLLITLLVAAVLPGTPAFAQDTWTQRATLPSPGRETAVAFAVDDKGYLMGGWNSPTQIFNDLWAYDPATDTWSQQADLPVQGRHNAVAMSIGTYGFVGTGRDRSNVRQPDWWRYDPAANSWLRKADLPGALRAHGFGFSLMGKGYVGGGYGVGQELSDFWAYDPATDQWTPRANYPGAGTSHVSTFALHDAIGYTVGGYGVLSGQPSNQTWQYDPVNDVWTQRASLPAPRFTLVAWGVADRGFVGAGLTSQSGNPFADYWTYDPLADSWMPVSACAGGARGWATGFAIGNRCFQLSGTAPGAAGPDSELWEYAPVITGLSNETPSVVTPGLWPNPTAGVVQLAATRAQHLSVQTTRGEQVRSLCLAPGQTTVDLHDLPAGVYIVRYGGHAQRLVIR